MRRSKFGEVKPVNPFGGVAPMSWEFMRDIGLVIFAAAIIAFGLSKISRRYLDFPNAALVATIGDAMMLD